jgi:hypothetical protein
MFLILKIEQVTFKDVEAEFLIPKWMNTLFYYLGLGEKVLIN